MSLFPAPPLVVDRRWLRGRWVGVVLTSLLACWFFGLGVGFGGSRANDIREDQRVLASGVLASRVVVRPVGDGSEWPFRKYGFDVTWTMPGGEKKTRTLTYDTFHVRLPTEGDPVLRYDAATDRAVLAWGATETTGRWLLVLVYGAIGVFLGGFLTHWVATRLVREIRDVQRCAERGVEVTARVVKKESVSFGTRYEYAILTRDAAVKDEIATLTGLEGHEPIFVAGREHFVAFLVDGRVVVPTLHVYTTELAPFVLSPADRDRLFSALPEDPRTAAARLGGAGRIVKSTVLGAIRSYLGI